ncbi:STM3941 family protein [Brevundimonas naejangsanensis]|uniref:STM3941 family protein n=1 Tax=Brevundimonas naejangsanensis TaxID=588932 RepID=UPI00320A30C3
MSDRLVLRRPRRKSALIILASAIFVAVGLWMIASPESFDRGSDEFNILVGWFSLIFFGAPGLAELCSLVRPTQLILTREGFQVHGLRLKPVVPWNNVECFFIFKMKSTSFVSFTLKASVQSPAQRATALIASSGRADGNIPAYLEKSADEVRTLLEEWRIQHSKVD